MTHDDLLALGAVEQRRLIGQRRLSPLELMQACIARIEALNPAVNAVCATDFERALAAARRAEAAVMSGAPLPLLHGLPLGVKDLLDTEGLLSTSGNIALRGHVPAADHGLVAQLRRAGAIVACKTNTPDMGAGGNTRNPVWGATGNPFDPRLNAGGSSGGSAAALATGMLPLCTGSDTGGSLRIPSALCGVVGLRPSPGLVANRSRPLGWSAISVLGPMGRDVADAALMLAACVGLDRHDALSYPADAAAFWPLPACDLSRLRVAFSEDFGFAAVDPAIRRVLRARVAALAPHVAAVEPLHIDLGEADFAFDVIRAEAFVAGFGDCDPATLGPNVRANVELARGITLADRARAHQAQTRIARAFAQALERVDLIVAPVLPVSPFPWTELYAEVVDGQRMANYYRWLALCYGVTLSAHPALSLPCGRDEQGMPFGLQVVGRRHGDAELLAAAHALQQALAANPETERPRPDLAALRKPRPELKSIVTHPPVFDGLAPDAAALRMAPV
ncbi:MAG: amidase [Proteobacteria bacterium]|nr:amidase [Pseudomonadota bacterium]